MNGALVKNWNNTVKPKDNVYFLGDWVVSRDPRRARKWVNKLNGHITSVRGNHDTRARGIVDTSFFFYMIQRKNEVLGMVG
jgi:calcineurin-like phosphoesterase family protein